MGSKKLMIFLLEGETDIPYIEKLFNQFIELKNRYVPIFIYTDGDITSRIMNSRQVKKVEKEKLRQSIWRYIDDWFRGDKNHTNSPNTNYKKDDIGVIVQIIDTDGRFIPEEKVVHDIDFGSQPVYTENCIKHAEEQKFANEMCARKNLLNSLLHQSFHGLLNKENSQKYTLCGFPHRIYYMSCNIEHVFWGSEYMCSKLNRGQKRKKSDEYYRKTNKDEFLNSILYNTEISYRYDDRLSVEENYIKSWEYIRQPGTTNSLKRMTNFNLFFKEYAS